VTGVASFPAPGQRCSPMSAARWPPGRDGPQRSEYENGAWAKNITLCRDLRRHKAPVCACVPHLAKFLSVCVGQDCFERLETGVDALHAPAFVAVGNLAADSSLLVLGRLRTEGDVGQAGGSKGKGERLLFCPQQTLRESIELFSDAHLNLVFYVKDESFSEQIILTTTSK